MKTMKVKAHIDNEGILKLEVPTGLSAREVEVVLVIQAAASSPGHETGWPVGFFGQTEGTLTDDPSEDPEQPPSDKEE